MDGFGVDVFAKVGKVNVETIQSAASSVLHQTSPSIVAVKTIRVKGWIEQLSKPASARTNDLSPPPKRPRRDTDTEVLPTHSVSAAGAASNTSALMLNERNTFSPPSSQAGTRSPCRANSPSSDNIAVRASTSPPITEPSSGLKTPPPLRVRNVMEQLEDGLNSGWTPGIELHAWGQSTARSLLYPDLNARVCRSRGRDENVWCMDVIQPLLKLAMSLEGEENFWLQSM
ncbi:hypothetical protein J3E71DRAFT_362255 [Bipolaris maydis]|nr:hypothetical protein J3E71DRAFT_362255 [Bipolaris maydis]